MSEFFGSLWWYLVTIGVLVTFHEFGHFWVARRCGVKVLKFSIGFGKSLWSRTGKDGTEYIIAAIPLGGFVSMLDERVQEVPRELQRYAHNNKSTGQKIAIAAAGPGFNFLLALLAFWLMFSLGKPDFQPILGRTAGIALQSGISEGSKVLAVDGAPYQTWSEVFSATIEAALYRRDAVLRVREPDGDERDIKLALSRLPQNLEDRALVREIGLQLQQTARVGKLSPGDPAEFSGLQNGDELLAINGHAVTDFQDFYDTLQVEAKVNPRVLVNVKREQQLLQIPVTAKSVSGENGESEFRLGIAPAALAPDTILRYNPLLAIPAAFGETWRTTAKTLGILRDMLMGAISPRHLSGPITIARVANSVAQDGLAWFLGFLGAVSIGIAILNLLPVPILDGGHILSYLIESIRGRPLSERVAMLGQYIGLAMLACLIGLALFNDVLR